MSLMSEGRVPQSNNKRKRDEKKLRRYQHVLNKATGVTCSDVPTKFLGICNAGQVNGLTEEIIVEEFGKFGCLQQVLLLPGKSCAFISYRDEASCKEVFEEANGTLNIAQGGKPVYLTYVTSLPESDNETVFEELPPGLTIINDFVSPAEEERLLSLCKFEDSDNNMKHRQVKHYGFEFRYDINNVDKDCPLAEQIPEECSFLWKRLNFDFCPDQLTVNQYRPGQGIPPHIDTHSAFEDPIISLSLGSDVVMQFKKSNKTVVVLLPRRSLAVIGGEARYAWTHGIIPRKFDYFYTSDGCRSFKRSTRTSFTFRKILKGECSCEFSAHCDSQTSRIENGLAPRLEQLHVHEVYDDIAQHFCETRHKPWPRIIQFIEKMRCGDLLVDVGCGNGKYFGYNKNVFQIGLDSSSKLNELCREKGFEVFSANCLNLPIRSCTADRVISIAVIHHLSTEDRRLGALREIARILRHDGEALIYVWAKQQIKNEEKSTYIKQDRKNWKGEGVSQEVNGTVAAVGLRLPVHTNRTDFKYSDVLVPWKLKNQDSEKQTFLRFYHVFEEGELDALCSGISGVSVVESYYDQGNYCVRFKKK